MNTLHPKITIYNKPTYQPSIHRTGQSIYPPFVKPNIYHMFISNYKPISHLPLLKHHFYTPNTLHYFKPSVHKYTLQIRIMSYSLKQSHACMRLIQSLFTLIPQSLSHNTPDINTYAALNRGRMGKHKYNWTFKASSIRLITMQRSPFVFKKSKDQFAIATYSYSSNVSISRISDAQLLLYTIALMKLPCELTLQIY